jgi:dipeptide/tripeptide permease
MREAICWLLGLIAAASIIALVNAAADERGWGRFALGLLIAGAGWLYLRHELAADP